MDKLDIQTQLVVYNFLGLVPVNNFENKEFKIKDANFKLLCEEIKIPKKLAKWDTKQTDYKRIHKSIVSEIKYRNRTNVISHDDNSDLSMTVIKKNKKKTKVLMNQNSSDYKLDTKICSQSENSNPSPTADNNDVLEIYMVSPIVSYVPTSLDTILSDSKTKDEISISENDQSQNTYYDIKFLETEELKDLHINLSKTLQLKKEINEAINRLEPRPDLTVDSGHISNNIILTDDILCCCQSNSIDILKDYSLEFEKRPGHKSEVNNKQNRPSQISKSDNKLKEPGHIIPDVASPESIVADNLRAIGDQFEMEHAKLLEESIISAISMITINGFKEALRAALSKLFSLASNGWMKVVIVMVVGQRMMALLMQGDRTLPVSEVAEAISCIIQEQTGAFILGNGGWNAISSLSNLFSSNLNIVADSEVDP